MVDDPAPRDRLAAIHPGVLTPEDIVEKPFHPGRTARMSDESHMQAYRHHLGMMCPLTMQYVKTTERIAAALSVASPQSSGIMEIVCGTGSDLRAFYAGFSAKGAVLATASKVVRVPDSSLDWKLELPPGRVENVTKDGRRFEKTGTQVPGNADNPMVTLSLFILPLSQAGAARWRSRWGNERAAADGEARTPCIPLTA